jgi:uncharacterized RDD family membrane protein YckC
MTEWYYADRQRRQIGPQPAETLIQRFRAGEIDAATLVWREGLASWQPLGAMRAELGLDDAPATLDFRVDPVPAAPPAAEATYAGVATPATGYSPYAAPAAAVGFEAAPVQGGEVVQAGFWKRVAANFIDSIVVGVVGAAIGMLLGLLAIPLAMSGDSGAGLVLVQVVSQLVSIAITAAYYAYFHASRSQATLGKMAVGIKVVRTDGSRISLARGIGRYFGFMLSSLILGIGLLMAAFTERKQALHDLLCDTLVVDKWAFTDHPEWQRRELGTVTVVVLVLFGLMMAFVLIALVAMIGLLSSMNW